MKEVLAVSEPLTTIENISFSQACDLGRRVVAVAHKTSEIGDSLWDRLEFQPETLAEELMTTALTVGKR